MPTRPQIALGAFTLLLAGGIAGLVFLIVARSDGDDEPDPPGLSRDLTAAANVTPLPTDTPIPDPVLLPASSVMFCVPSIVTGEPRRFMLAPEGAQPRYRDGTCERIPARPDMIAVTSADGADAEVRFEQAATASDLARIVWMPARALLSGEPTVLTGRFILDARIEDDEFGESVVVIEFQQDGPELLRTVTRENIGLPMTLFIDGEPVRTEDGALWHSVITDETEGPIVVSGLITDGDIVLQDQLNALLTDE